MCYKVKMYVYWDWIVLICSCIASSGEVLQLTSSNQQALLCSFQHLTKHCLCLTFSLSLSHPDVSGAPQLQHLVPWLSQVSQRATLGHTFAIDHVSNNHQVGWTFLFKPFWHHRQAGRPEPGRCRRISCKEAATADLRDLSVPQNGTVASPIWSDTRIFEAFYIF